MPLCSYSEEGAKRFFYGQFSANSYDNISVGISSDSSRFYCLGFGFYDPYRNKSDWYTLEIFMKGIGKPFWKTFLTSGEVGVFFSTPTGKNTTNLSHGAGLSIEYGVGSKLFNNFIVSIDGEVQAKLHKKKNEEGYHFNSILNLLLIKFGFII
jgi:hypothetical protein